MAASGVLVAVTLVVGPAFGLLAAECRDPSRQILVPAGSFWIGSDGGERALARNLSSPETVTADWFSAELPRHRIRVNAFCIDRLLVTQSEYAEFVAVTRHQVPGITHAEYLRQGFLVHEYETDVVPYL